jgi:hypothetical protein
VPNLLLLVGSKNVICRHIWFLHESIQLPSYVWSPHAFTEELNLDQLYVSFHLFHTLQIYIQKAIPGIVVIQDGLFG